MQSSACETNSNCSYFNTPEQLRVALLTNNTVTVSWRTSGMPNGSDDTAIPQVKYGRNETLADGIIVKGTSATYTKVGIISWFHDVVLAVNCSTRYYYQILAAECVNSSKIHSFKSQPAFGDPSPINITIVGDMGCDTFLNNRSANRTIKALSSMANFTDLFIHVGDMSYADDPRTNILEDITGEYYEISWNQFQKSMETITADNIYMTAPGNHEATCIQFYDCYCELSPLNHTLSQYRNFTPYLHRFSMPGGGSDRTYQNMWYSFQWGLAHIIVINTETDFPGAPAGPNTSLNAGNFRPDNTQVAWFRDDLERAKANRCKVPWIIVLGHRPWYGSVPAYSDQYQIQSDNCPTCRDAFAGLIYDNEVDFYFGGHVHLYERLYPVDRNGNSLGNSYYEPEGPIYITTGAGGAPEGVQRIGVKANASAFDSSTYGFSQLQLIDSSVAKLYFYQSSDLTQLDNVTVTRTHKCPTTCSN